MTKEQVDVLIKDGDIIPGAGEFYIPGSDTIYFSISVRLYEIFDKIFNWYADLGIDEFKEVTDVSLKKLQEVMPEKDFFRQKLTEEIARFDDLIKSEFFREIEIIKQEEHKNYWFYFIENEHLFNLIDYLKFDILKGKEIPNDFPDNIDFSLFEIFFISDNLKIAYDGMRLEKRIAFVKDKLDRLEQTMKTEFVETSIPKKTNPIEKAAIAMLIVYRGIVRAEDENYVEKILKEMKLPINKTFIKNVKNLCNKFHSEDSILDTKGNTNAIISRKNQIESILPFLKDYPTGLSKAQSNLLTLSKQL